MTGPEHYREAERLIADLTSDDGVVSFGDGGEAFMAAAQVHATLALAAATTMCGYAEHGMHPDDYKEWSDACNKA